jgi:bacteriorhodopsin
MDLIFADAKALSSLTGYDKLVGFTFFLGYMAMFAASIFFIVERGRVAPRWKLSMLISALITFIAAVHYFYMRGFFVETQQTPTELRYLDWTLTVPLMCVEFFLLLRPAGAKPAMLARFVVAAVVMLVTGFIGESFAASNPTFGSAGAHSIFWGFVSTIGWAWIIYEIFFGPAKKIADSTDNEKVQKGFKNLSLFALIGWAIYPIGYMAMDGNLLAGVMDPADMNVVYNIGDAVNKIGFGLVVYSMAIADTKRMKDAGELQTAQV